MHKICGRAKPSSFAWGEKLLALLPREDVAANAGRHVLRACAHGNIAAVQKFVPVAGWDTENTETKAEHSMIHMALAVACSQGQLEVVQYLWQFGASRANLRTPADNSGFEMIGLFGAKAPPLFLACKSGNLALVQWLWGRGLTVDDARKDSACAFRYACEATSPDVAVWMWGLGLSVDDIRDVVEDTFGEACLAGQLETAQTIWRAGLTLPEISYRGGELLAVALCNRHFALAQWLQEIGLTTTVSTIGDVDAARYAPKFHFSVVGFDAETCAKLERDEYMDAFDKHP